jgi:riboflavin synthase alpha subunit
MAPPILNKPYVKLVKSTKDSYSFVFKKHPELKYKLVAVNCVVKLNGNSIVVTNLAKKKSASVTLVVSDSFKQTTSNKFFQFTSKKP